MGVSVDPAPAAPPRREKSSNRFLWAVGVGVLVPVFIYLIAMGPAGVSQFFARRRSAEAKLNVRQLCRLALRHHEQQKLWRNAGPLPTPMPKGEAVAFPDDEAFKALGFEPGKVRYQYEVKVESEVVRCSARGDLDGDGVLASFSIAILKDSREITAIDIDDELE